MSAAAGSRVLNPAVERLTRDELLNVQLQRTQAQVSRCASDVAFYRDRWRFDPTDIASLADFRRLVPTTAKQDFVAGLPEVSGRLASGVGLFQHHMTSGTTGLGQETHPLSEADHEALAAGWHYQAHWAGLVKGDRICFTWPIGLQTGGLSTQITAQRVGLIAVQLAPYSSDDKLRYLRTFQPQALVASPSYLSHLAHLVRRDGQSPAEAFPNLKVLFVAGESYPIEWATEASDEWGCLISEWYGLMQGGMNQAFSCETGVVRDGRRGALHCLDHRLLTEVLDPETGEPTAPGQSGEVVVTTLTRDAFPIIRFRTNDRVRILPEPCPCGRPSLALEAGTVARYDDMLKVRGQNLWPAAVDSVVLTDPRVAEYAAVVEIDDGARERVVVHVELVPGPPAGTVPAELLTELQRRVKSVTNVTMDFQLAPADSLPRYEFKARRWDDRRRADRDVVRYVAPS